MAVRNAVNASGSIADTAIRVAGSVPPKIAKPTKPSTRPSRSRDSGEVSCSTAGEEDMMRDLIASAAGVQHDVASHDGYAHPCNHVRTTVVDSVSFASRVERLDIGLGVDLGVG